MSLEVVGEPITLTLCLGGMRGPEGSISQVSFDRRRKVTLTALIQEASLPFYIESEDACVELGKMLGESLHRALSKEAH